ncbi:MAG: 2-oxoacid:acceptor oxidoreductase family protein [bacterium]|nr:2-oxoacid:acceptor oxidoreductase family protein [bacterium]
MKILLAGEGGQGVQLAAETLAKAAFLEGKSATLIPNFGVEQRGGVSLAFVIIETSGGQILYPKFGFADVAAIFCDRALKRAQTHLGPKTQMIYGPAVAGQPTTSLPPKAWNIFVLKKILEATNIVKKTTAWQVLAEKLKTQFAADPNLRRMDQEALQ